MINRLTSRSCCNSFSPPKKLFEVEIVFENLLGQTVKISYFSFRNNERAERFIIGKLISEDENFLQIQGRADGTLFTINKEHIIEIVQEETAP